MNSGHEKHLLQIDLKVVVLAFGLGLLALLSDPACTANTAQPSASAADPSTISVGSRAPDFSLSSLSGETATLSSLRGKPVFLNFWASW